MSTFADSSVRKRPTSLRKKIYRVFVGRPASHPKLGRPNKYSDAGGSTRPLVHLFTKIKGANMKAKLTTILTLIIILFAALVFPSRLSAQDKHNQYRIFNLGNLSGTASGGNNINKIRWGIWGADET